MLHKHYKSIATATVLALPMCVNAGEILLIPKLGYHQQDNAEIQIGSNVITLKNNADSGVIGFEGGYLFDFGLALTGEVLLYQLEAENETGGPLRGEVNVAAFTANATYHFNHDGTFQPLIGAGIGSQVASVENSNSNADFVGYRVQGKVGFLVKFTDTIGMTMEYKRVYFSLEDEDNDTITYKSRGNYFGAGLTIHL
jgi:outer membrane protein W